MSAAAAPAYMEARRWIAVLALTAALVGLFVAYGAVDPDPSVHDYPEGEDVAAQPDAYVGERATLYGEVVSLDPVVVEVEAPDGESVRITARDAPPVEVGQHLIAHGTVGPGPTFRVEEATVRDDWQFDYMYAVSAVAGLWVLARAVDHWRFDVRRLGFAPRDRPLSDALRGGDGDA